VLRKYKKKKRIKLGFSIQNYKKKNMFFVKLSFKETEKQTIVCLERIDEKRH
jgi:hypothetical protein